MNKQETSGRFTKDIYRLSAVFFLVFMGAGAQQAYLVRYLEHSTSWSPLRCGGVISCVYLGMMLFRLLNLRLFPNWQDRSYTLVGASTYMLFTLVMMVIPWLPIYALALGAALLWGAGAALMWTGTSMQVLALSDRAGGRHGTGMGILYCATHAGWLCGAMLLGWVYSKLPTAQLFWLYALASAITFGGLLIAITIPANAQEERQIPTWREIFAVMGRRQAQIASLLQFLSALAYGLILGTFGRYVEQEFGKEWVWITISLYPATRMALSLSGGRLTDRLGQAWVLFGGFLFGAAGLLLTVLIHSPLSAMLTSFSLGVLNSTVPVTAGAIVGKAAVRERRSLVYGVIFSWRDAGVMLAAAGSNLLGKQHDLDTVFQIFAIVFALCSGLSLLLNRYVREQL